MSSTGPPKGGERGGRATQQTKLLLSWWNRIGIDRADLAVRLPAGTMIWHREKALDELPLGWARAQNAARGEVYVRPARWRYWPLVFLDDVPTEMALKVARKYAAAVVQTSLEGGCHLWLACSRGLNEDARARAQRWLASKVGADPRSTSGEHLGRLPGVRNWKRGGNWINVLAASLHPPRWDADAADCCPADTFAPHVRNETAAVPRSQGSRDCSPSGLEWARVCSDLERGVDPETIYQWLLTNAQIRRGRDAERYARTTIRNARNHVRTSGSNPHQDRR